jgi:dipeptidyl aminopeptidase/acylaminoacyl peptidase
MGVIAVLGIAASGLLTGMAAATPAQRPFALEDVVSIRSILDLSLSPDGRAAAFTVRLADLAGNRYEKDLWSVGLDGGAPARRLTFTPSADAAPRWSPDGSRIGFLSDRGGTAQVWALPAAGGDPEALTAHGQPIVAFDWAPDGRRLLLVAPAAETEPEAKRRKEADDAYVEGRQWRNGQLFIADLSEPGRPLTPLTDGTRNVTASALWSPDGARVAFISTPTPEADADEEAKVQILELAGKTVRDVPGSDRATAIAWAPGGRILAFVAPFDGKGISRQDLFLWSVGPDAARGVAAPGGGSPVDVTRDLDRDVEQARFSRDGLSIDVLFSRGATQAVARLELPDGRRSAAPSARPPRTVWEAGQTVGAFERAGGGWVYVRDDVPEELWTAGPDGKGRRLTRINEEADGIDLPTSEAVRWESPAGAIEGILVRPAGHDPSRRCPLVVKPHGGPRAHSNLALDPQACYLASRGYLVLKPNVRGSTGYGDAFVKGNIADWGDGPLADLLAGIDLLVARGMADGGRQFLYGWSYGGYLTNWAVTHTDRFRAAASGAGVADLRMQYTISDARRWRFDYFGGSPFTGSLPIYERESPVTYARQAKVPTLFVHGEKDDRCPPAQGRMMHRALADNGVESALLIYPREGHEFVEPRHVLDRIRQVAEWFARHDPGAAVAIPRTGP